MTTQRHENGPQSHDDAERVQGEGREGFVASTGVPEPKWADIIGIDPDYVKDATPGYFPRDYQQECDDLAARLAEAEAKVARVEALALGWEREFGCGTEAHRVFGQQLVTIDFAVREIRRALDGTR